MPVLTPHIMLKTLQDITANIAQAKDICSLRATHEKPMCAMRQHKGQIVIQLGGGEIPSDLVQQIVDGLEGSGIKAVRL